MLHRPLLSVSVGLLAFLLFIASVYRAWTLSISMDEAYTYLSFVAPPLKQILSTYSPNHNVLYSLLAKASTLAFGASEFSLRAPALVGGLLCQIVTIALSLRLLKNQLIAFLCVCLIALNPMVFDYMSEARGYSLALACFLGGLLYAVPVLIEGADRSRLRLVAAAGLFGLSVAAHLMFAIPILAFNMIFAVLYYRRHHCWNGAFWRRFVLPQIVVAGAITGGPLLHAQRQAFVGGFDTILQTLNNFAISCVLHDWDGNGVLTYQVNTWVSGWFYTIFRSVFVLAIIFALFISVRSFVSNGRELRGNLLPGNVWLLTSAATIVLSTLIAIVAHILVRVPYPFGRFVLYWWPLWVIVLCLMIERLWRDGPVARYIGVFFSIFALTMTIDSALQFDLSHFGWLQYSAGTRAAAKFIRDDASNAPPKNITISVSGSLYPSLDFYRSIYSMDTWRLVLPSGDPRSVDYVVRDVFDKPQPGYRVVWKDSLSKATIAVPLTAH